MFLNDTVDNAVLARLIRQAASRRYASTYLLTGKETEKQRALAVAFAKAVCCKEKKCSTSCGCGICARVERSVHPDVKWFGLDEEANSIKIGEVREFQNWLALKPYEGDTNVFIFLKAGRLTVEAQNALLKSLEEPPSGNVILLLAREASALLPTVVSRSVEIKVPPFNTEEIQRILVREGGDEKAALAAARLGGGDLARARKALHENWPARRADWVKTLEENPVSFFDQFHGAPREKISEAFSFLEEWLRDTLVVDAAQDPELLIHRELETALNRFAGAVRAGEIFELLEKIREIKKSLDDFGNQKLALTYAQIVWEQFRGAK